MKFQIFLETHQISEWKEFYIDFHLLKHIIKPLSVNFKTKRKLMLKKKMSALKQLEIVENQELLDQLIDEFENSDNSVTRDETVAIQKAFQAQIITELQKVAFFADERIENKYKPRLQAIEEQLELVRLHKEYQVHSDQLELAVKELYKEILLMKEFIDLNFKVKNKIMKKFKKINKFIHQEIKLNVEESVNSVISTVPILCNHNEMFSDLLTKCEKVFYCYFSHKYEAHVTQVLKDYAAPATFTQIQAFYLGFFVGLLAILLILCYLIAHNFHIDIDEDVEFRTIFPMFRTFGIICIYLWVLGLNVWAWNHANINYKACFNFTNHYSDVVSICRRAAFFSFLLMTAILCYLILRTRIPFLYDMISFIPLDILPLICWMTLIIYMFFPFQYFNYIGRMYTCRLFIESIASIFVPTSFRHVWFMDQLTSLIGPMRDIEYTLCYYAYYSDPFEVRKAFCSQTRGIYLCIGIFPNFCRILQCIRRIIDTKSLYPQIFNVGKYSFNILVCTLSFLWVSYPFCHTLWWITALISTAYSYTWDIKFDFGFLQPGTGWPLREKLSYKNHFIYYLTVVSNLFLRFLWILSVSPEVMREFIRPEFLALSLFLLEALRRGMWNFIRVELEHIDLCKEFRVTSDVELPFCRQEGKWVLNDRNLLNIIHMEREDKIKFEMEKLCQKKPMYHAKAVDTTKVKDEEGKCTKATFAAYIEEYQYATRKNVSELKNMKMPCEDNQAACSEKTSLLIS